MYFTTKGKFIKRVLLVQNVSFKFVHDVHELLFKCNNDFCIFFSKTKQRSPAKLSILIDFLRLSPHKALIVTKKNKDFSTPVYVFVQKNILVLKCSLSQTLNFVKIKEFIVNKLFLLVINDVAKNMN